MQTSRGADEMWSPTWGSTFFLNALREAFFRDIDGEQAQHDHILLDLSGVDRLASPGAFFPLVPGLPIDVRFEVDGLART